MWLWPLDRTSCWASYLHSITVQQARLIVGALIMRRLCEEPQEQEVCHSCSVTGPSASQENRQWIGVSASPNTIQDFSGDTFTRTGQFSSTLGIQLGPNLLHQLRTFQGRAQKLLQKAKKQGVPPHILKWLIVHWQEEQHSFFYPLLQKKRIWVSSRMHPCVS